MLTKLIKKMQDFAIRNSQFAIRNSQFAIRNSQFAIKVYLNNNYIRKLRPFSLVNQI